MPIFKVVVDLVVFNFMLGFFADCHCSLDYASSSCFFFFASYFTLLTSLSFRSLGFDCWFLFGKFLLLWLLLVFLLHVCFLFLLLFFFRLFFDLLSFFGSFVFANFQFCFFMGRGGVLVVILCE